MAVKVFIDASSDPKVVEDHVNAFLADIPDQDVKNVQLSSHVVPSAGALSGGSALVHVARITYQTDES